MLSLSETHSFFYLALIRFLDIRCFSHQRRSITTLRYIWRRVSLCKDLRCQPGSWRIKTSPPPWTYGSIIQTGILGFQSFSAQRFSHMFRATLISLSCHLPVFIIIRFTRFPNTQHCGSYHFGNLVSGLFFRLPSSALCIILSTKSIITIEWAQSSSSEGFLQYGLSQWTSAASR